MRKRWIVGLSIIGLMAFTAGSCSSNDPVSVSSSPSGAVLAAGGVGVTLSDFGVVPAESSASAGEITFDIKNDATVTIHEFVVFRSDLAPDLLPTDESGNVDEEGDGVEHIDEVEDIAPGATESLTVTLDPGSYVLICNLPGHYHLGMHAAFTVV